ncbi:UPF0538 protein C2orf76 homolog isoform X1 [Lethenteron reissneri]|uniref:UPF0538 protein C2orf76 homolog isoform X1 n=2 Tax=Lethenteron reissneri TaxID=7753 RepID=UPI002AB60557|nr:UPF0538 protein C2orf76 homolog isoform X1 [Lethenteron reissneri]
MYRVRCVKFSTLETKYGPGVVLCQPSYVLANTCPNSLLTLYEGSVSLFKAPCMSEAACRAPERPGLETVTLCVRLVRSFEHRNFRELVFHDVAVSQSVRDFMSLLLREIPTRAQLPPPFKKHTYDTLKIIHQAHGAKTNELVVSLEDDEHLLLHDEQTLHDSGVRHETVLAFFLLADYNKYKMNPTLTW